MKIINILIFCLTLFIQKSIIAQNNSINFDGNNDFINLPIGQNITATQTSIFTIEFWTTYEQTDNANYAHLFAINSSTGLNRIGIRTTNSTNNSDGVVILGVNSNGSQYLNGSITVGDGNCHFISIVSNGSRISLYVDGVFDNSMDINVSVQSSDLYSLGQEYDNGLITSQFFNGNIDEMRIWNTERTQTEIQVNMTSTLQGSELGLVAYYTFNQGLANENNTSEISLTNSSQFSGLNGTFNNFNLNGTTSNFILNECEESTNSLQDMTQTIQTENLITYPNPSSKEVLFNLNISNTENVKLFDINGKLISMISVRKQNNIVIINIQHLDNGMYFIHAIDNNGILRRTKFTKIE